MFWRLIFSDQILLREKRLKNFAQAELTKSNYRTRALISRVLYYEEIFLAVSCKRAYLISERAYIKKLQVERLASQILMIDFTRLC